MHPPLQQSTKSYHRRQPLQQIQPKQTEKPHSDTDPNDDGTGCLTKQVRNLKLNTSVSKPVSLANIVSGNYPRQQQQQRNNNENYSAQVAQHQRSNNKYHSQENVQPMRTTRGNSKYLRNNANHSNTNGNAHGGRYAQSGAQYGTTGYGQYGRHAYSSGKNRPSEQIINKDDLRYTAKYWTSTAADTEVKTNEINAASSETNNNTSSTTSNSSNSSIVDNSNKDTTEKLHSPPESFQQPQYTVTKEHSKDRRPINTRPFNTQTRRPTNNQQQTEPVESSQNDSDTQSERNAKHGLDGIDLRNHASVVIVDYLPESALTTQHSSHDSNGAVSEHEDVDETGDDGFQQVMTRKKKKAEKLKAAAAAANLVSSQSRRGGTFRNKRVLISDVVISDVKPRMTRRMGRRATLVENKDNETGSHESSSGSSTSSTTSPASNNDKKPNTHSNFTLIPANATTKPGAQKYNQVVNNNKSTRTHNVKVLSTTRVLVNTKQETGNISPSVDLNLKIESCKKVWDSTGKNRPYREKTVSSENKKIAAEKVTGAEEKVVPPPLMSSFYDKTLMKQVEKEVFSVFVEPTPSTTLVGSMQKQTLNDTNGSGKSNGCSSNEAELYLETNTYTSTAIPPCSSTTKIPSPSESTNHLQNLIEPSLTNQALTTYTDSINPVISDATYQYNMPNYPLSSSANNLVGNIIIKNVSDSPSPSVSSYLSMPSLSNNSFGPFHMQQPQQHQSYQNYQNYYNPFNNALLNNQEPNNTYNQNQGQFSSGSYPQFQQKQSNFIQHLDVNGQVLPQQQVPLLQPPYPLYQPNFQNMQSSNSFEQQILPQQGFPNQIAYNNQFEIENNRQMSNIHSMPFNPVTQSKPMNSDSFSIAPGTYSTLPNNSANPKTSNTYTSQLSYPSNQYQQPQQHHTPITATNCNSFNPFNSNPFFNRSSQSSESSNFFNCSNNSNSETPTLQHQMSQENANLYSLFNTQKPQPLKGFLQNTHGTLTPSNSSSSLSHLTQLQQNSRNSPDFFRITNKYNMDGSLSRQISASNIAKQPLLEKAPSFDNGVMGNGNTYPSLNNGNSLASQVGFESNGPCLPNNLSTNSSFFNGKNGLTGVCNINDGSNSMFYSMETPNQYYPHHHPHAHYQRSQHYQTQPYIQTSNPTNQPALLNQPHYQSPLLPQPPSMPHHYNSIRPAHNEFSGQHNPTNRFQRYPQYPHVHNQNQRNSNYVKTYNQNNHSYNHRVPNHQSSTKSSSPPKPVQKITILPKPKNNPAPSATSVKVATSSDPSRSKIDESLNSKK